MIKAYLEVQNIDSEFKESNLSSSTHKEVGKAPFIKILKNMLSIKHIRSMILYFAQYH